MSPRWTKRPGLHLAAEGESRETPNQEKDKMQNDTEALDQHHESWVAYTPTAEVTLVFWGRVLLLLFLGGGLELTISKVPSRIKISLCPGGEQCSRTLR